MMRGSQVTSVAEATRRVDSAPWFPQGVLHWYGVWTGSWWAFVPGAGRLIEAATESALAVAVHHAMYGPAL